MNTTTNSSQTGPTGQPDQMLPRIEIDPDQCKGCEYCTVECPKGVIEISKKFNKLGYLHAQYKGQGCSGCTACFYACPEPGAITVYKK